MNTLAVPPETLGVDDQNWGASTALLTHEQTNLATLARVEPCWNAHDVPAILEHYSDGITWHNVATGETRSGKASIGAFLTELFDAVPDLTMHITRRIPRGDLVAEEYTIEGTHRGTLFGIPATGSTLRLQAVSFVELRDGRLHDDRFYFDISGLLHQMGLFPPVTFAQTRVGHRLVRFAVAMRWPLRRGRTVRT